MHVADYPSYPNFVILTETVRKKFDLNPSQAAVSGVFFSNFDKCRPEVAGDVISGPALVNVGADVRAIFFLILG